MKRVEITQAPAPVERQEAESLTEQARGPITLDAALLRFVSGGAPCNNWGNSAVGASPLTTPPVTGA